MENQLEIEKYIETLTDKEKLALNKAKEILGDSFALFNASFSLSVRVK